MLNNCGFSAQYRLRTVVYALFILPGFGGTALADHYTPISEYVPELKGVSVISKPFVGTTYGFGEVIKVQMRFVWPVKVTGTPSVLIRFHDGVNTIDVQAQYTSGSGSSRLNFHYTVASTDADNNGLEVSSPINLNNGSIKDADSNNSLIDLTFTNVSAGTNHMVNGGNDNRAPMLSSDGISIISTPFMGTTYGVDEVIKVQAQFLRPVSVDVNGGTPSVLIRFHDGVNTIDVQAQYTSGSGSSRLNFHYTVASTDADNNGLEVSSPIKLNGGVIQDIGYEISATGDIDFTNVSAGADHKVDGSQNNRVPMLSSDGISIISAPYNGTAYQAGEVIKVQAQFLRPVSVSVTEGSSRPKVRLRFQNAGSSNRQNRFAQYTSGSGSSRLEFHYTVQSGNTDDNGLAVRSPVRLYDQDITDLVTGVAISNNMAFDNIGSDPAHKVDGSDTSPTAPKVRSADIITPPGLSTLYDANPATVYGLGDIIKVGVQLFRSVTVDVSGGTPSVQLKLYVGSTNFRDVHAAYTIGSGSDELEFHYVVAEGDTADSIELWSPINLNGGTIKDKDTDIYASGDLDLFESSFISIDQKVDYSHNNRPKMPKIIGAYIISIPQIGTTYGRDEVIKVQITFREPVIVDVSDGTPSVELGTNMYARYHSGTGSDALEFHYEVQSSDNDANGIEVISPVQLNGGTIQNQSGGDSAGSDLAFNDIPANTNHKVDGSQDNLGPAVTLSVNPNQVTENGGAQVVTVTAMLANTTTEAVTVTLSLSGTAIEGTGIGDDYSAGWSPTTRQISIAAGSTSGTATVTITPTDDSVYENDETIVVSGNSSLGGQVSAATVTLAENEAEPAVTLSVSPNSVSENDSAMTLTVAVGLEGAVASPTRVQLMIANESTATFTKDYTVTYEPLSRMLTIPAGDTTCPDNIEVIVTPVDDSIYEKKESIILSSTLSGYTVSDATVTLLDNDVKLEVSPTSLSEGAGTMDVTVTATLPGEVLSATTVNLSLGGTATQDTDYTVSGSQSITISSGGTSGTTVLTITPEDDETWEPDETIRVSGSATNFTVTGVEIILSDNDDVPIDQMTFTTIPTSGDMYQLGEAIEVGINFKEIVYVDTRGGTPTITLSFDEAASGAGKPVFSAAMLTAVNEEMRIASYVRGSGTTVLVFAYTVEAGDRSTNGISVVSNSLSFNGGMIQDVGGNPIETTHASMLIGYKVNGGDVPTDNSPSDNSPPEFPRTRAIREVAENTPVGEHVGDAVTASDADGDAVTYSLSGDGAAFFAIDAATGQLMVGDSTVLNYESDTKAHGLMVMADDGNGGVETIKVIVLVTDVDEPPGKPDAPTVASASIGGRTSFTVSWTVPANTGPAIEDYDVAYRVLGTSAWIDANYDGVETATSLTGLAMDTMYEVRVRASNAEGTGQWSDAGTGNTDANTAPIFSSESVTLEVAENTPVGEQVGEALTVSDADSDAVTYSLSGDGAVAFAIDAATGQLTIGDRAMLDYESDTTIYGLIVKAVDGYGGVDSLSVTVTVTNVDEPPGKPEVLIVAPASIDGRTSLAISWLAPANTGPAIGDYDVAYRVLGTSAWTDANYDGVETATLLTGLAMGSAYAVRVRASNDEGTGQWSNAGTGSTDANTAPIFSSESVTLEVAENTPVGEQVGEALTVSDADSDAVTYSLSGDGAVAFAIDAGTGQLTIGDGAVLDYESNTTTYGLMVMADDGNGGVETIKVIVLVTDVDEPPGKPDAPTVASASVGGRTSLAISWTVPANTGPAIGDYDVAYRVSVTSAWTDANYDGVETTTLLAGLAMGSAYAVRVRASNVEGTGQWSDAGTGNTDANTAPVFSSESVTYEVAENTPAGEQVGDVVTASDADGDAVTYSLSTNESPFAIDVATGQLTIGDEVVFDYESDTTAYGLMVMADDGNGGVDSLSVTVTVTNVDEPPGKPEAPTVTPASIDGRTSLTVSWTVPANTGPAIEDYDVAYRVLGTSAWIDANYDGVETATLLVGLAMGSAYEVRVRASNAEGTGQWSDAGIGNTDANTAPVFSSERVTFEVAEDTPAGEQVGDVVTASDADGDALTYSLSGDGAVAFSIDAGTGQLTIGYGAVLDYESDTTTYDLTVMADDGYGGVDSLSVTVTVTDVDEPPGKSEVPTIVPADSDGDVTLAIGWMAPSNTGPAIEDYDVAYRVLGASAWIDANYDGVEIATSLTGLTASTAYEVRVRASNAEGTGQWSDVGTGNTAIARPNAPVNLTAHPGDGEVTLIWDDPQNATITVYEYRLSADADWINIPHSLATTTQYTITGLVNGTVYTFALRAVNSTAAGQAVEVVAMPVVLVNVSFEADSYTVREGSEAVRISIVLDNVADREILLPIASEVQAGTEVEDYTLAGLVDGVLPIATGARAAHFTVTAERDADREDERVVLSFGDLPVQVSAGVPSRAMVLLEDLDKAVAARLKALNQAILPEVARAMTASTMDAIANRLSVAMSATSSQDAPGREISIGGYPLSFGAPATLPRLPDPHHHNGTHKRQPDNSYHYRQEDPLQMLTRSSFVLPVNVRAHADSTSRVVRDLMLWGSGTYRNLNSRGSIDWHGDLFGGHIGADARVGKRGLAGVLLSFFKGSFTYSDTDIQNGDYESQMLSVYPYLGWSWQSGLRVWAAGGLGTGEIGIDGTAYQMGNQSSAMSLQTLAMGASGFVLSHGSSTLRLKGEAWRTHVGLDARGLIDALTVAVQRTRLTLEGASGRTFLSGGHLTQVLELGLRYDRGDGSPGGGVEIGGGLRYVNASGVLTIEGRGRSLLVHQADYREWGASGLMVLNPGGDGGGLSLRLMPVYGQAQSGINQLYDSDGISAVVGGQNRQSHLDAEVGYGWSPGMVACSRPISGWHCPMVRRAILRAGVLR